MTESEQTKTAEPIGKAVEPRVILSPHPLGGIQVTVRSADGNSLSTRIDLPEATILLAHLQAIITMMFQSMYAQAAERQPGLITPGG